MYDRLANAPPHCRLLRWVLRLPVYLYRIQLGWLLGSRFLLLTYKGYKSGVSRQVVLEVVRSDYATGTYIVASGWGEKANWYKSIQQTPEVTLHIRSRRLTARAFLLTEAEACREMQDYARRHPVAFRSLAILLAGRRLSDTEEDVRLFVKSVPLVAFRHKT